MNRLWMVAGMAGLVLLCGCGPRETVVRITEVPDIDHSAIDEYVDITETEVDKEGLTVIVRGTAKVALGQGLTLDVQRYKGGSLLDTVVSRVTQVKQAEAPAGAGAGPPPEGERQPPPYMMTQPPPIPPIEAGDPVVFTIDATTDAGKISKLVIRVRR